MPRITISIRLRKLYLAFSSAQKTLQEVRGVLEEVMLTMVTLWSLWHLVKVLFFWAS